MLVDLRRAALLLAASASLASAGCSVQPGASSPSSTAGGSVAAGGGSSDGDRPGSAGDGRERRCNAPAREPIAFVDVPGAPFGVVPTADGCWVFVSVAAAGPLDVDGVALLRRDRGPLRLERVVPLPEGPTGMVLTHDGRLLVGAVGDGVVFLDVGSMLEGSGDPVLGRIHGGPGSIYVNVTPDDGLLFVSDESAATVTVVDLERARTAGFGDDAIIGRIPVGRAPIALAVSPDGRWLYNSSQLAAASWGWPIVCKREASPDPTPVVPEGAVVVVDVARARIDPASAVVRRVPAGCSPVRAVLARRGETLWVTARNADALLAFDASLLVSDPARALLGAVPVGRSPVGVATFKHGRRVVVANSNRFAPDPTQPQTLTVVDATRLADGSDAVMASLPAGAFPRELAVSPDGRTLFVANFLSSTIEVVDLRPFLGSGDDDGDGAEDGDESEER